jgi:hypothetical protein
MSTVILQNSKIDEFFIRLKYKLRSKLKNKGKLLLGTDILRKNKKTELFKIVTLNIEAKVLDAVENDFELFNDKIVLLDLIKSSTEKFLFYSYGINLQLNEKILLRSLYVKFLLTNSDILLKLPFRTLLNFESEIFRTTFGPIYPKPSRKFLEALFDNLIVEISNCVMQILINELSFLDHIRQILYKSKFLSLRNIERFKNGLAWQIRVKLYVTYPKYIYSSQYGIWIIRSSGIYYRIIYANRIKQLFHLKKASLVTLTLLEIQDFLAGRIDELLYLIGDGFRNVITITIGQSIGLIYRGIIESLKK